MGRWWILASVVVLVGCASAAESEPVTPSTLATTSTTATVAVAESTTTSRPLTAVERCLRRAVFSDPDLADYVLPYPPGTGYSVIQSYCNDDGSHENQLAYDFGMPIGSDVVAARGGTVIELKEDVADRAPTSQLNYLLIRHGDGTIGFYAHLTADGALVEVGDGVAQGQVIALSGETGRTGGPVLHFGVYPSYPPVEGFDLPVTFANADGQLDPRGGLFEGGFYWATNE